MLEAKLGEAGLLKKVLDGEPVAMDLIGTLQCLTINYTTIKELPRCPCGSSPAYKRFRELSL